MGVSCPYHLRAVAALGNPDKAAMNPNRTGSMNATHSHFPIPLSVILATIAIFLFQTKLFAEPPIKPNVQPGIVVSGFEPFGGRKVNASEELARALAKERPGCRAVILPVVWGAPMKVLAEVQEPPDLWIAFGEGGNDFRIEIKADNRRADIRDNNQQLPAEKEVVAGGGPLLNPIPAEALAGKLKAAGFPVSVSREAGDYLCEEMLYSLLWQRQGVWKKKTTVMFIHLPVLGEKVKVEADHPAQVADREYLLSFAAALFTALARQDIPAGAQGAVIEEGKRRTK